MRSKASASALLSVVLLTVTACGGHGGTGTAGQSAGEPPSSGGTQQPQRQVAPGVSLGANKSFAKITYQPTVRKIAAAGFVASLVAVSDDGHTLVFHDAPADIRGLSSRAPLPKLRRGKRGSSPTAASSDRCPPRCSTPQSASFSVIRPT